MLPKLKKKIMSFLMDEKGTISKEKLLKGAIVLSGIGLLAKKAKADYDYQDYLPDQNAGYGNDPSGVVQQPPALETEIAGRVMEHDTDGGSTSNGYPIPSAPSSFGGAGGLFGGGLGGGLNKCYVLCWSFEGTGADEEIMTTNCVHQLPIWMTLRTPIWGLNHCLGCNPLPEFDKRFPAHANLAFSTHKSANRVWHTNNIDLRHNDNGPDSYGSIVAHHKHHGKHNNVNLLPECDSGLPTSYDHNISLPDLPVNPGCTGGSPKQCNSICVPRGLP